MRKIDQLFAEYGESHQNPTNKMIHWICVPLIFWSIVGFISLIPSTSFFIKYFGEISLLSILVMVLVSVFYARLSRRITVIMVFLMLLMQHFVYFVHHQFALYAWLVFLSVFVVTWIFQFIGHKIEGKKPSFLKDLQFLLVGPIWLLHFVMKKWGWKY